MSESLRCRLGIHRWTRYGKPLADDAYTACRRCGKHRSLWGPEAAPRLPSLRHGRSDPAPVEARLLGRVDRKTADNMKKLRCYLGLHRWQVLKVTVAARTRSAASAASTATFLSGHISPAETSASQGHTVYAGSRRQGLRRTLTSVLHCG